MYSSEARAITHSVPGSTLPDPGYLLSLPDFDASGNPVLLSEHMPPLVCVTPEGLDEARAELGAKRAETDRLLKFKVALSSALGMFMALGVPYGARPAADMLRTPTSTEVTVDALTEKALGQSIILRCLSQPGLDVRPSGTSPYAPGKAGKVWIPGFELMWVEESFCQILAAFADNPVSYEQAMQDTAARDRLKSAARAAKIVAHEFAHTRGIVNESGAECIGDQLAFLILEAAGADATPEFVDFVTRLAIEDSNKVAQKHPEYSLSPTCHPGSPYDWGVQSYP